MTEHYRIKLSFTNLDENLHTKHLAYLVIPFIYADDLTHAKLLAERLEKKFGADSYEVWKA